MAAAHLRDPADGVSGNLSVNLSTVSTLEKVAPASDFPGLVRRANFCITGSTLTAAASESGHCVRHHVGKEPSTTSEMNASLSSTMNPGRVDSKFAAIAGFANNGKKNVHAITKSRDPSPNFSLHESRSDVTH